MFVTIKDGNNVMIRHDKKFFTSELCTVIHDAIPLILHCKKIVLIPKNFSTTYIVLYVQSVYTPSQIQD